MKKYLLRPLLAFVVAAGLLSAAVACKKACYDSCCGETFPKRYFDIEGLVLVALDGARSPQQVLPGGATVSVANFLLELRAVTRT